jgi:hypothetical protein
VAKLQARPAAATGAEVREESIDRDAARLAVGPRMPYLDAADGLVATTPDRQPLAVADPGRTDGSGEDDTGNDQGFRSRLLKTERRQWDLSLGMAVGTDGYRAVGVRFGTEFAQDRVRLELGAVFGSSGDRGRFPGLPW